MATEKKEYIVNSLPASPEASSVYYVKNGTKFKIYVTDTNGTAIELDTNSLNPNDYVEVVGDDMTGDLNMKDYKKVNIYDSSNVLVASFNYGGVNIYPTSSGTYSNTVYVDEQSSSTIASLGMYINSNNEAEYYEIRSTVNGSSVPWISIHPETTYINKKLNVGELPYSSKTNKYVRYNPNGQLESSTVDDVKTELGIDTKTLTRNIVKRNFSLLGQNFTYHVTGQDYTIYLTATSAGDVPSPMINLPINIDTGRMLRIVISFDNFSSPNNVFDDDVYDYNGTVITNLGGATSILIQYDGTNWLRVG